MADSDVPKTVRAFIAFHVDSLVSLEILLLLHGNERKGYTASDVARELRIEPLAAASRLADLRARGMLVSGADADPIYRYDPSPITLGETIDLVAKTYASHRVSVTALIFAKPPEALRSFADAFRIRKDQTDG